MLKKITKSAAIILAATLMLSACSAQNSASTTTTANPTPVADSKPAEAMQKITVIDAAKRELNFERPAINALPDGPNTVRLYTYVMGTKGMIGVSPRDVKGVERRPYALAYKDELLALKHFGGKYAIENYEEVLLAKPDVFFSSKQKEAEKYDSIQAKINAPVVCLDQGSGVVFDPVLYDSIITVGKIMGNEKRAKEVVDYMEAIKADLHERTKDIPADQRAKVYAGGLAWQGPHGIEGTRSNYPLFDAVNAHNVVDFVDKDGLVEIDKEQLLKSNPDFIFIDLASIDLIQDDYNKNPDFYKALSAFQNGKVYAQLPFVWCNVNVETAMANAYYVGKMIYPDKFKDIDPIEKTNEIYKFLVGKPVYQEIADREFGGFQNITLEDLAANKFFKEKAPKK